MGKLIERDGSLFDSNATVIGHGCNIRGAMASGIAGQFKRRFPKMEAEYRRMCKAGEFELGDVWWWDAENVKIANLMTQINPGPDARHLGIVDSVRLAIAGMASGQDILALPQIGCGIGGLTWETGVRPLLAELADESWIDIEVWTPHGN